MIYAKERPERPICAILPPWQDAPEPTPYALRGTCAQNREQSLLLQEAEKHNPQKSWGRLPGPGLRDMLFYPAFFSRPADAGEVHVATTNSGEFRIGRFLVVRMLAFLALAVHAEDVLIEAADYPAAIERAATPVAFFYRQKSVRHFRVLLGLVFGFRGFSVSPALVCKFSVLFMNSQSESEVNRT